MKWKYQFTDVEGTKRDAEGIQFKLIVTKEKLNFKVGGNAAWSNSRLNALKGVEKMIDGDLNTEYSSPSLTDSNKK